MTYEQNDRAIRGYHRFKWFVFLLLIAALAWLIISRSLSTIPAVSDVVPVEPTAAALATPTLERANDESTSSSTSLSWDNAEIDSETETLILFGRSQPGTVVNILLDEQTVGTVPSSDEGNWELELPLPESGRYGFIAQMLDADNQVLGDYLSELEIPEIDIPAVEPEPVSTEPAPEPTAEPTAMPTEAPAEATTDAPAEPDESNAAASDLDQPVFNAIPDIDGFEGGILSFAGNGTPNSAIEFVVSNDGSEQIEELQTDDIGDWSYTTVITAAGSYDISARTPGSTVDPAVSFTIANDIVYATDGNCLSGIPPFGTISGRAYVVAPCEYFSLIAERLQVSYQDLLDANPQLADVERLDPGEVINIP